MSIDVQLRSRGIGGSEIAAICGLDNRRDAFSVWADKMGKVKRSEPNSRMKWGKRVERVIAEAYGEETRQDVRWCDETMANVQRPWQVFTPDAFVWGHTAISGSIQMNPVMGVDAKNVAFDQAALWGEPGSDLVPNYISLQCQWYCSGTTLPAWDIAGLFGGNDMRIYRVHHDKDIEAVILDEAETFWKRHVIARVPPAPSYSPAAAEALKQMFPRNVEAMRQAAPEEMHLVEALHAARVAFKSAERAKDEADNRIKLAIAESDGLLFGKEKITWKACKDTLGTDWEKIARLTCGDDARLIDLIAENRIVTKQGSRRLLVPRSWGEE